jgi:drug/metabolite transporter (DMT)-like permease
MILLINTNGGKIISMKNILPIMYAILAALCYGISTPISKLLLIDIPPVFMAGLLYVGAGVGIFVLRLMRRGRKQEAKLTKKELPYTLAMVGLDILAPILLMVGLQKSNSATVSLLNNFEIVATSIIALVFFKEIIRRWTWIAVLLITIASIILSIEDIGTISLSLGALLVLLACVCWGLENNCTNRLSTKDPLEIVVIKGLGSGFASIIIGVFLGQYTTDIKYIVIALILGFVAYGLSITFYIYAQRYLGAAKTSAYYAFAPFIGAGFSFIIFKNMPTMLYIIALVIMIIGAFFVAYDGIKHETINSEGGHGA